MSETKRQYLDLNGLQTLWAKVKASDEVTAKALETSKSELNSKISSIETAIDSLNQTVESQASKIDKIDSIEEFAIGLGDTVDSLNQTVESQASKIDKIDSLENTVTKHTGEITNLWDTVNQLEAGGNPGEITYITIEREGDNYVGDSAKAPTTTSVVSALNSIEDKVDLISMDDYYSKEEVDELVVEHEPISIDDINKLN